MRKEINFPSDTPIEVQKKQIEMVLSKSIEERLQIWAAMTDFLYYQNIDLVKKKLRTDDRDELIMGYIEMCYGKELKPEYLEWIREKYKQTKQLKQDKQNGN